MLWRISQQSHKLGARARDTLAPTTWERRRVMPWHCSIGSEGARGKNGSDLWGPLGGFHRSGWVMLPWWESGNREDGVLFDSAGCGSNDHVAYLMAEEGFSDG